MINCGCDGDGLVAEELKLKDNLLLANVPVEAISSLVF